MVSALALLGMFPFFLLVLVIIRWETPGGGLFWQRRVGLEGKEFQMVKFRTMVKNADKLGPYYTQPGDVRVTQIGQFLRRTSIDELPQLWNVLKGDMSLVGPRPVVQEQKVEYSPEEWKARHSMRPGMTGLAQALLRSEATPEQRKALDLEYVQNRTLWLDFKILFWTIRQVLYKGGH